MLRQLPEYSDAELIRTRDPGLLKSCDVVVDVGGEYDPSRHRYDHHQKSFKESFSTLTKDRPKWNIKLSSAGLVYLHFGERIIRQLSDVDDEELLKKLYSKMYENFIMEIDAIDNGIAVADGPLRYSCNTSISARVGNLNPWWNSPAEETTPAAEMTRFRKAMVMVEVEFKDRLQFFIKSWWPARSLVREAMAKRNELRPDGAVMLFNGGCPWKAHLLELEEEFDEVGQVKYVVYPDNNGKWRIQCVPVGEDRQFENRLSLPESWRGLRDDELSEHLSLPGCVFVHASGFIGGHNTKEGALEMANMSLKLHEKVDVSQDK